jgi:hypothetical protein
VREIVEQLGPINKMAWEKQITLNMILTEKWRWEVMCTHWEQMLYSHPQQYSSRWVLQGLTAISNKLPKNSRINDPLTNWLEQWFGKWKGVITSILTSLIVVFVAIALIGYCVMLCIWGLILRLIESTLTRQTPVSYQLLLSTAEIVK